MGTESRLAAARGKTWTPTKSEGLSRFIPGKSVINFPDIGGTGVGHYRRRVREDGLVHQLKIGAHSFTDLLMILHTKLSWDYFCNDNFMVYL